MNKNSYCLGENITWLQDVVFCLWLSWFCVILLALYENPSNNNNNSDFMEWAQLDPELFFFQVGLLKDVDEQAGCSR